MSRDTGVVVDSTDVTSTDYADYTDVFFDLATLVADFDPGRHEFATRVLEVGEAPARVTLLKGSAPIGSSEPWMATTIEMTS
jgi:hypothetical protein